MSNLPPLPLIDGCLFIDNSGFVEQSNTCYRKLEYAHLHKRILAGEQPALTFGSALHTALEYRYVKSQNNRPDPWIDDEVAAILTTFFADHPTPEGDHRTLNWAVELFRRYNEKYSIEEFSLLKYKTAIDCHYCSNARMPGEILPCPWCATSGKRELMVEMSFALPLFTYNGVPFAKNPQCSDDIPIFYTGRIDLPVSLNGEIFVTDHKSASFMGPAFFDRMHMSTQQRGYCWAFKELTGIMPRGYIVNGIRTSAAPDYVNDNSFTGRRKYKSPEDWWRDAFQRERYFVDQAKLDEWKTNVITKVEEFLWHYSRGYLPMNSESCTKYNMRCPFFQVCELEPSDRMIMLNSGTYITNTWSPLKAVYE